MKKLLFTLLTWVTLQYAASVFALTQTEAHVSIFKKDIENHHPGALTDPITLECIEKENELNKTHYVLYRAHKRSIGAELYFYQQLFRILNPGYTDDNFMPSRPLGKNYRNQTVLEFLDSFSNFDSKPFNKDDIADTCYQHGGIPFDMQRDIADKLISVNLSLFGGLNIYTEDTYTFFKENDNVTNSNLAGNLALVFTKFNLNKKYIPQLIEIISKIQGNSGTLVQFFIPKEIIDNYVYLSKANGVPYNHPIVDADFDQKKQRHTKISSILEKYMHTPTSKFNELQGRILITNDGIYNPNSGIKIFTYQKKPDFDSESQLKFLAMTIAISSLIEPHSDTSE